MPSDSIESVAWLVVRFASGSSRTPQCLPMLGKERFTDHKIISRNTDFSPLALQWSVIVIARIQHT